jgi:hypothetical protein
MKENLGSFLLTQKAHSEQRKQQLLLGMISRSRKLTEEPCTVKCGQKNRFERQFELTVPTCGQPVTKITIQYRTSISLLSMQDFIVR